jgi:hypothetical protein
MLERGVEAVRMSRGAAQSNAKSDANVIVWGHPAVPLPAEKISLASAQYMELDIDVM